MLSSTSPPPEPRSSKGLSSSSLCSSYCSRLERHGCLAAIDAAIQTSAYTTRGIELPEVRHFLYKSRTSAQFTSPELALCYQAEEERKRLCGLYLTLQNR